LILVVYDAFIPNITFSSLIPFKEKSLNLVDTELKTRITDDFVKETKTNDFLKERTTNLVIINDIFDITSLKEEDIFLNIFEKKSLFPSQSDLSNMLSASGYSLHKALDEEQLVLCTKSVWLYFQESVLFLLMQDAADMESLNIDLDFSSKQSAKYIIDLNIAFDLYKDLYNRIINIYHFNEEVSENFTKKIREGLHEIKTKSLYNFFNKLVTSFIQISFKYYEYKNILNKKYICKKVDDNYLLFIPHDMHSLNDFSLGLSYTDLPDYEYQYFVSRENFLKEQTKSILLESSKNFTGAILIAALNKLKLKNLIANKNLLPFFNIFIQGHGNIQQGDNPALISELSIEKEDSKKEFSDFFKILNFFDNALKTKTVSLFTCFLGGKQILETYDVKNKLNDPYLENLSYTILNIGTLYGINYGMLPYQEYFNYLNKQPADYVKATEIVRYDRIANYISIKLPHTSWFTPVQLKNITLSLSQVDMSTRESDILVSKEKEIIILGANYISKPLKIIRDSDYSIEDLPVFMPSNYYDQRYFFNSIEISDIKINEEEERSRYNIDPYMNIIIDMFFKNIWDDEEDILFLIQTFKINTMEYRKILFEYEAKDKKLYFAYIDSQGKRQEYFFNKNPMLENNIYIKERLSIDAEKLFDTYKKSIELSLPSNLRPDYIKELNSLLKSKIVGPSSEEFKLVHKVLRNYLQNPEKIYDIKNMQNLENISLKIKNGIHKYKTKDDQVSKDLIKRLRYLQNIVEKQIGFLFKKEK